MAENAGITNEMLDYFIGIGLNNYREYFEATRKDYERVVKKPLYALAEELLPAALDIDPDMEQRPSRIVSRIRRDTRFTKDKSPYRSHMWLSFYPNGTNKAECLGLYYSIGLQSSAYGMGYYEYSPARAKAMRQSILLKQNEFLSVLTNPEFAAHFALKGEDYKKIELPAELNPALHSLYRKKNFYVEHDDGLRAGVFAPEYSQEIAAGLRLLKPLYDLLLSLHL